jgi:hypothetical protein
VVGQTIAAFVFSLIPGGALGIILLCCHLRPPWQGGGVRDDVRWAHVAQVPFLIGPALLAGYTIYEITIGTYHPPEVGMAAGVVIGMAVVYGYFYVSLRLWRGRQQG